MSLIKHNKLSWLNTQKPWAQCLVGMSFLWMGLKLCFHPRLRSYMMLPLLSNILVFTASAYFLFHWFNDSVLVWLLSWIPTELPTWLTWLDPILGWLIEVVKILLWTGLIFAFLFFAATLFTALAHTVAAPFNALLAEKVEALEREIDYPSFSIKDTLVRSVQREVIKWQYWAPRVVSVLFISLLLSPIPLVNLLPPLFSSLFAAWMLAMQYLDFSADNLGLSLTQTLARMRTYRYYSLGFGCAVLVMTLVPVLNFLSLSSAVIGSTLLWVHVLDADTNTQVKAA